MIEGLSDATSPEIAQVPSLLTPIVPANAPKRRYGEGMEACAMKRELGTFDFESCPAWSAITYYFGRTLRLRELKGIVLSIIHHVSESGTTLPRLSRNSKRSLGLLVKYINDHYSIFVPLLRSVTLCDEDWHPISFRDAGILTGEPWGRQTQP